VSGIFFLHPFPAFVSGGLSSGGFIDDFSVPQDVCRNAAFVTF
jgi:hypothetical protein